MPYYKIPEFNLLHLDKYAKAALKYKNRIARPGWSGKNIERRIVFMRIVVLDGFALNPGDLNWDEINAIGDTIVYDRTEARLIVNRISNCDVVLTNKTPITRETIDACPSIRFIGILSTGYNTVDVAYAQEKGIVVCNVPDYCTNCVAQHVFAMLLAYTNHIAEHAASVREGAWKRCPDFSYWKYPISEIYGKTMGIIGLGRIGKRVASIANAFGMKVLAYTPDPDRSLESDMLRFASLDEVLSQSDCLSLHCPLTDETRHLIRRETIAKMKPGMILINTSRGQLINELDLSAALMSGKIRLALLDVLSEEPPRNGSPLIDSPRCVVTPHISWAPREARMRLMSIMRDNLIAYRDGHPINTIQL